MAERKLKVAWLRLLPNAHHDNTTQQIDDFATAFTSSLERYNEAVQALHTCRQKEDEVWLKVQRDPAAKELSDTDKRQDGYISCVRSIIVGHAALPVDEETQAEAKECQQVFKDYKFNTREAYGAAADKIIQMRQNLLPHQAFLTSIGAWTLYEKGYQLAVEVRRLLGERAMTKGEFIKGEMRAVRRQTDLAIANLYSVIEAMLELMPSNELNRLITQLKGIEIYAKQYYLNYPPVNSNGATGADGSAEGGNNGASGSGTGNEGGNNGAPGDDDNPDIGGGTDTPGNGSTGGGSGTGGSGNGDDTGGNGSDTPGNGDDNGGSGGGNTPPPTDVTEDGIE